MFIIRKLWRSGSHGYDGPTCDLVGIEGGKNYKNKQQAQTDCNKLNKFHKMFEVVDISEVVAPAEKS